MNKVIHSGRFIADPELKMTQSGIAVCTFSLAVKRPRVKDTTDFFTYTAWRQKAEFITKYFKKGDPIEITGVLTSRKYEDKDGNKRTAIEVEVEEADFCLTRTTSANEDQSEPEPKLETVDNDSDLPF